MKVADLFCGVGGLSQGFVWAGCKIALGIEHDPEIALSYKRIILTPTSMSTTYATLISKKSIRSIRSSTLSSADLHVRAFHRKANALIWKIHAIFSSNHSLTSSRSSRQNILYWRTFRKSSPHQVVFSVTK